MKKALKKGFTLVELIVVIAILAVLLLLIVPQVTGYVKSANESVAKANVQSFYSDWVARTVASEAKLTTPAPMTTTNGCAWSGTAPTTSTGSGSITCTNGGITATGTVTDGELASVTVK